MKLFKKYLPHISIFILLCVAAVMLLTRPTIKVDGYNTDNAYNTIKELSSDKYKGRAYGSKENEQAVAYIENQFKTIGLKPAGENGTYLTNYSEIAKSFNGKAVLELLDKDGKSIKQYKYGEDFIEQNYDLSCAGELTSEWKHVILSDFSNPRIMELVK